MVTGDDVNRAQVVATVASLISKSLATLHSSAPARCVREMRHRLLDTKRTYLLQKLIQSGE